MSNPIHSSTTNLLPCESCSQVHYCRRSHQSLSLPDSTRIQEAITALSIAEQRLLEKYPIPEDRDVSKLTHIRIIFANLSVPISVPRALVDLTQSYANALRILIATYIEVNTCSSLQSAYQLVLEFHYLKITTPLHSPGRPLEYTISTLLYMKEDQLCYSYICGRWRRRNRETLRTRPEGLDDWEALQRLADREKFKKDVFEGLKKGVDTSDGLADVQFQAPMVLLYFWWVRDLKNLQLLKMMERWLVGRLNFDVYMMIREYMADTVVIRNRRDLMDEDKTALIKKMESRMRYHFRSGHYMNGTFWEQMLEVSENDMEHTVVENARLECTDRSAFPGTPEADRRILSFLYWPFRNTPGAFEYVRRMIPEIESSFSCDDDEEEDNSFP
ncbi:hypothetical protein TWF281_006080 [Arthrobotrys megalospora]